jgi:hypothetical protein
MKAWLRIPFSLLALLAMFATMMPETVWACPMTGRIDVASRVCLGAMPSMSGKMPSMSGDMPCAHMGGKCCKPLSVPASQTDDDDSGRQHIFAAAHQVSFSFDIVAPVVDTAPFVVPATVSFEAPAVRFYLARFANSPPAFWTQHRPLSVSGRAPPVL